MQRFSMWRMAAALVTLGVWGAYSWTAENGSRAEPPPPAASTVRTTAAGAPRGPIYVRPVNDTAVRLCQWGPAGGRRHGPCRPPHVWPNAGCGPQTPFGQGAYVRPGRIQHVPHYRLRVDDQLELVYRRTRNETTRSYQLSVGDTVRIEMKNEPDITRELVVQPDGTITLPLLKPVRAARLTIERLRQSLESLYSEFYVMPTITVTPVSVNTKLQDIIDTVDARFGSGGQVRIARITPDGTIALPAIGVVPAQGLTLEELKREVDERYATVVEGLEVQPVLLERAPRFVFVLGEVLQPGRYVLEGPTTVIQAVAIAGGVTTAANARLHEAVVLRRGPDWRLLATKINLYPPIIHGNVRPRKHDDLWVSDADVIIVPKTHIAAAAEFIDSIFTRGVYGVLPFQGASLNFAKLGTL